MRHARAVLLAALAIPACRADGEGDPPRSGPDSAASAAPLDDTISVPVFVDSSSVPSGANAGEEGPSLTFRVHPSLSAHTFTLLRGRDSLVVGIRVREQVGTGEQVLRVSADESGAILDPAGRLSVRDIDFDGYGDLAFVTMSAQANAWSDYWRFDPRTRRFTPVGNFQVLEPDTTARELTSYNRGGHAGRLFTASRYRWIEGRLAEVRREAQDWDDATGRYVHVVSEPRDGRLVETSRTPLAEGEVRAGPSWERGEG